MFRFPIYKPHVDGHMKKLVNEAIDSGWISSKGKFVDEFEKLFALSVKRKHAISMCNGTVALHAALEALQLPINSAVICPTLTYVASANAIRHARLIPLFIDCNENGISETAQFAEGIHYAYKNSVPVSAIMPIHLYGICSDVDQLMTLSDAKVVEDCAESFGSIYKNKPSGSGKSQFACFSFFGNKTITTGEGGMVVCDDDELNNKIRRLRNVGQNPVNPQRYQHIEVGYNYRMTNICAAIGVSQLETADYILARKREIARKYRECLAGLADKINFISDPVGCIGNNWLITIGVPTQAAREGLMLYLEANGVETRPAFLPMHVMINLGDFYRVSNMKNSEDISSRYLNLPSFPDLKDNEVEEICDLIIKFFNKYI